MLNKNRRNYEHFHFFFQSEEDDDVEPLASQHLFLPELISNFRLSIPPHIEVG